MSWTDERVELLRKLWEEGVSASQIATQLGGVSRNAVIGKVHRLKISRPEKTSDDKLPDEGVKIAADGGEADVSAKRPVPLDMREKIKVVNTKKTDKKTDLPPPIRKAVKGAIADEEKAEKENKYNGEEEAVATQPSATTLNHQEDDDEKSDNDVVVPISRRLTLLQLTENTCKWPIGDPLGAGFHFCGAKTCEGSPYCSYHSKIAFQPVAERRRIRV